MSPSGSMAWRFISLLEAMVTQDSAQLEVCNYDHVCSFADAGEKEIVKKKSFVGGWDTLLPVSAWVIQRCTLIEARYRRGSLLQPWLYEL